jgi:hypothetical protein
MNTGWGAFVTLALLAASTALADETAAGDASAGPGGQFAPPNDGYDWIQLTSGEWLKGELIAVFNDEVEFDSDILDELVIDGEDVLSFVSPRTFGVSLRNAPLINGRLELDEKHIIIITESGRQQYPREQLVAITAAVERERDRWSGDLTFGVNAREGNTQFIETNIEAGVERRTPQSRLIMEYLGTFNETGGEQVANSHRVNLVVDRFSRHRFFWRPLISEYYRDPFKNIAHQGRVETGVGYHLIDTRKTEWDVYTAVGVNYVRRDSGEEGESDNQSSPSVSFGTDYDTELTSWLDYLFSFQMSFLDEESGDYQHHLVTTLSTDLIYDIDLDMTLIWDRTEKPPPDASGNIPEQDDFRLMVGISFEF